MPKNFIKRYIPDPNEIKSHKHLSLFGDLLHDGNLWHLNRRSAAGAFAVGLMVAWIPIPFQMLLAAAMAILCRVNLPLSVALVWVSNPVTMPALFYCSYRLGAFILVQDPVEVKFEVSFSWLVQVLETIGPALLLGCTLSGILSATIGYFGIRGLWRFSVVKNWEKRKARR